MSFAIPLLRSVTGRARRIYHPLDEKKDEIRLLTISPKSSDSELIHCNLQTHSLKDYTENYQYFLVHSKNVASSKRQLLTKWARKEFMPEFAGLAPLQSVHAVRPHLSRQRFQWGDYAALSYVWGDENVTRTIILNDQEVQVTANLAQALQAFRDDEEFDHRFKLWVDALCINQKDLKERARQIRKMRNIYGSAWTVVAWLGDESDESSCALQLLRDFAAVSEADRGKEVEEALKTDLDLFGKCGWLALEKFMRRSYWRRMWVIQELVLGASATWIRCGSSLIDWSTFHIGIAFLQEHMWHIKDEILSMIIRDQGLKRRDGWQTTSLHLVYHDLSVSSVREETGGERLRFGRLLDLADAAECKDPRDKVYAIVGLFPPSVAQQLRPDYNLPIPRVYASTARKFIELQNTLDPIREGNPWGPSSCPSWAADWQWKGRTRWSRTESQLWGPNWLTPHVEPNISCYVPYRASLGSTHDCAFSEADTRMTCSGFIVDQISGISARGKGFFEWWPESIIQPSNWESVYGGFEATTEALYRTLVQDRVIDGKQASKRHSVILSMPSKFGLGEQFSKRGWTYLAGLQGYYYRWQGFREANANFQLGSYAFDSFFSKKIPKDANEFDYTEVYRCFDRSSHKRRFIVTKKGYMGWGPDNIYGPSDMQMMEGDLIAILFGCSTPVVIRPYGTHFLVVGEAYVQGLMDGEAMTLLERGKFRRQTFAFW
ncbi:HET-domain-containing protein [Tothia fuscella]|uniref:HET-domain-containing protein n=1 Tax=Tothia fuscella TaxID=1048955 RepID=A0A9P4P028_9PEZI|nr:HET-domain-containing protein [Tothia fuscella]